MSFFPLIKKNKKNKESYSLVFNISSGSITGAIIKFTERPGIDVFYSKKVILPVIKSISAEKRLAQLKSSLNILLSDIEKQRNRSFKIDRVFYLFSSPWSVSQTKTILVKENKSFKITESYLNKIIAEDIKNDASDFGKIIEKKIIQLKINGYVVEKARGQVGNELEISLFRTMVPEYVLSTVEEIVTKYFHVKEVWCHSLSLPVFSVTRDLFPHKTDFINIDIGDELTDLSLIKDGIIVSVGSFPVGRNFFIKELAETMRVGPEIADSMVKVSAAKVSDELANLKISVAMNKSAEEWSKNVSSIITHWKEKMYVPDTVFLIANHDITSFVTPKLKSQELKFFLIDRKNIRSDDVTFKICLMFLDKIYKI